MGWAFGNRTSRMLATDYPERVASVTLIAAGGLVPALTERGEIGPLVGRNPIFPKQKSYGSPDVPCSHRQRTKPGLQAMCATSTTGPKRGQRRVKPTVTPLWRNGLLAEQAPC